MICLNIGFCFCFLLSILAIVLCAAQICGLVFVSTFGKFSVLITSNTYFTHFFHSSPSGIPILLYLLKLSRSQDILCVHVVCFFVFILFSLFISLLEVSVDCSLSSRILSLTVSSLMKHQKHLYSCSSFFYF